MDGIAACVKDPGFWQGIIAAFFQGMARGFEKRL
jgi:hypothetical protein